MNDTSLPAPALFHRAAPPATLIAAIALMWAGPWPAELTPVILAAQLAVIVFAVFSSVHHADVIARRTGEPYGTLVLTVAVTVIELALIFSIMLTGKSNPTLARDTVFAVVMLVCNGLVGACLLAAGLRYGEVSFRTRAASAYMVMIIPLASLTLVLPNYTISETGPFYSTPQLIYVSVATLILYGVFLYVQTVRHPDYFLSDPGSGSQAKAPPPASVAWSAALLIVALAAVVLLAKGFAESLQSSAQSLGAPAEALGLLVALIVLMPESIAALRSARKNQLQKSLNLALGSSLATIGLTIPGVVVLSLLLDTPLALGLDTSDVVLLAVTFGVSLATFSDGRTNILPGVVHLVLFATFVFLIFSP